MARFRALAVLVLLGVGCDDGKGQDTDVLRLRSGVFVDRGDPQGVDGYARTSKRMTLDVEGKTVRVSFRAAGGGERVETYRIRGR